jgi:hypothetical protein
MPTKLMMVFIGVDLLFAGCGGLLLGFSLMSEHVLQATPTIDNVTQNLLLGQCPLSGTTPVPPACRVPRPAIAVTRALVL